MTWKRHKLKDLWARRCSQVWLGALTLAVVSVAGFSVPCYAELGRSFVLRAKRVYPMTQHGPFVLEPGIVVVRDGKIVAVGSDIDVPTDLPIIELRDESVVPGFVAAASNLIPPHRGDESVAAGYHAIDAYRDHGSYDDALSYGVTTAHLSPGEHRLVTGQGAVVKLGGEPASRVLVDRSDLVINLGQAAYNPPRRSVIHAPSSADVAIIPAIPQRPSSRLGQVLALELTLAAAFRGEEGELSKQHAIALADVWRAGLPVRLQADRAIDLEEGIAYLERKERRAYLVGGVEADRIAGRLRASKFPLVYRVESGWRDSARDIGFDPDALEADLATLGKLGGVKLALAGPKNQPVGDLRLAASTALRGGLDQQQVLAAITRVPADILGVSNRVGSLSPGLDADLVVLSGKPLETSTHVQRVFIDGAVVFEAPCVDAVVVRGDTIWISDKEQIQHGEVLIEHGKITAVGHSVPRPPFAKLVDMGAGSFVAPGMIDAFGHLGLHGDRSSLSPELSLANIVGVPDVTERRVARSGITSVILSPYKVSSQGSQATVVKTAGLDRDARVARSASGIVFDFSESDAIGIQDKINKRIETAKKYDEKWKKYVKELEEWKEKQAKGEVVDGKPKVEEETIGSEENDPITGTWALTISGGPLPEPQSATMKLKLSGTDVEGRLSVAQSPQELKLSGTFDGKHLSAEVDIDVGGAGSLAIEMDLTEPDHLVGNLTVQGFTVDLDAMRTDSEPVEFKVVKRRTRGKGGRPLPPKVDDALEPWRLVFKKEIPIIVSVKTAAQIEALLKATKEHDIELVLLGAQEASILAKDLVERSVGVVVPRQVRRLVNDAWYYQADDLSRHGVAIAFQSDAEDAARALPLWALQAVERGLSPDAALAALTTYPARMFKMDDRVGSLAVGRDGDIVVYSGHPFRAGSRVERVFVSGKEVQ